MTRALRIFAAGCCVLVCVGIIAIWLLSYQSLIILSFRLNATQRLAFNSERGQLAWNWHRRFPGEATGRYHWRAIPYETSKLYRFSQRGKRIWPPEPSIFNFALGNRPDAWRGAIPHWFALLIVGTLAVGLHPRTKLRFKTRDLLVITTAVAFLLTALILGSE